jgi:Mg-chelatase subunit ChlD
VTDTLRRATIVALGAPLALALLAAGCDTNARFNINKRVFDKAVAVSTVPAKQAADGSFVPQCGGGEVDGFLVNVALLGTEFKGGPAGDAAKDKDRSIRPADIINTLDVDGAATTDIRLSGTTNLGFTVDCIDPLPDADPVGCGGVPNAGVQIDDIQYEQFAASRSVRHNVLILVDMSGSIKGWVDKTSLKEESPGSCCDLPQKLNEVASDFYSLRVAAVREFISDLNADDHFGLIGFGEGVPSGDLVEVPCKLPEVEDSSWEVKLDKCFGAANDEIWIRGVNELQGGVAGRSTLWDALDKAYGWLKNRNQLKRTNHILVITDGPDTCESGENFGSCQAPCPSAVGYQTLLDRLAADVGTPNVPQIHIHFVQFESLGYPGRDPRQMDVACRSGGLYQHINSNELSKFNETAFQLALRDAVSSVRLSLMGYWRVAVGAPVFGSNSGFPGGVPMGSGYGLGGQLTVKEGSRLVARDEPFFFGSGQGQWDTRLSVRKACGTKVDCGAEAAAPSDCTVICSQETLTCPNGDAGVSLPDTVSCLESTGICCGGVCEQGAGATCTCN